MDVPYTFSKQNTKKTTENTKKISIRKRSVLKLTSLELRCFYKHQKVNIENLTRRLQSSPRLTIRT